MGKTGHRRKGVQRPRAKGTWGQGAETVKINLRFVSFISININFGRRKGLGLNQRKLRCWYKGSHHKKTTTLNHKAPYSAYSPDHLPLFKVSLWHQWNAVISWVWKARVTLQLVFKQQISHFIQTRATIHLIFTYFLQENPQRICKASRIQCQLFKA